MDFIHSVTVFLPLFFYVVKHTFEVCDEPESGKPTF